MLKSALCSRKEGADVGTYGKIPKLPRFLQKLCVKGGARLPGRASQRFDTPPMRQNIVESQTSSHGQSTCASIGVDARGFVRPVTLCDRRFARSNLWDQVWSFGGCVSGLIFTMF